MMTVALSCPSASGQSDSVTQVSCGFPAREHLGDFAAERPSAVRQSTMMSLLMIRYCRSKLRRAAARARGVVVWARSRAWAVAADGCAPSRRARSGRGQMNQLPSRNR